jgi:hypothetical protein
LNVICCSKELRISLRVTKIDCSRFHTRKLFAIGYRKDIVFGAILSLLEVLWRDWYTSNFHYNLFEGAQNRGMLAEREPIQYKCTIVGATTCDM